VPEHSLRSLKRNAHRRLGRWLVGVAVTLSCMCLLAVPQVGAHGIWAHVHVTGWAIEALPEGELRDFMEDDDIRNAAHFGAAFTDSGYWPQSGELKEKGNAYSEHMHWEPFVEEFIHWIRVNDPPPWSSLESKKRVAFLLGLASHGLQDEIFDSLFLFQVEQHDGAGQDEADPASDGALAHAGMMRFMPTEYIPFDALLEIFQNTGIKVEAEDIQDCVNIMNFLYLNAETGQEVALSMYDEYHEQLPWSFAHFFDPNIPGSVGSEIQPTAAHIQAVWKRLHDTFEPDDTFVHAYPAANGTLLGTNHESVDSWITFIFGMGTKILGPASATLTDDAGVDVPLRTKGSRWGADYGRLHRYMPQEDLEPGAWYNLTVPAGMELMDGGKTTQPIEFRFRAPCDPAPCGPDEPEPTPLELDDSESSGGCQSGSENPWAPYFLFGLLAWVCRAGVLRRDLP
jgi:hypothetical protein